MRYGMPWQGSKSRIAEWVIDVLPPSHTLVDLFAGGAQLLIVRFSPESGITS